MQRRQFLRLATTAPAAGLLYYAHAQTRRVDGIKLGVSFTDKPNEDDLAMLRHVGVDAVSIWTGIANNNAQWMIETRKRIEAQGAEVYNIGIIDLHCDPTMVLGSNGVEKKIEQYKEYLGNLGRAGIRYTTYAHMANIKNQPTPGFYATGMQTARGQAPTREFDLAVARKLPKSFDREYVEEQIWQTFTKFIQAVIPVAEKNKVRIGLHPDDPPVDTLGGVARIFRNYQGYERAFEIAKSENFGACLCIGTWGEGGRDMGRNPVEAVQEFGRRGKLFKIHFRNVSAPLPKFREMFVDDGYMDMYEIMAALKRVNFKGIVIPDHVPGGGYPAANSTFTLGYMKALRDRVNKQV